MQTKPEDTPDFTDLFIETFRRTLPIALEVQDKIAQAGARDEQYIEYDGQRLGITIAKGDGSPLTYADGKVQQAGLAYLQKELAKSGPVWVKAEEDGVINTAREEDCTYRLIYDPIDGTGNYSGITLADGVPRRGNMEETPDIENHIGWGSMLAIQQRVGGEWKTVASGIYESTPKDAGKTEPQGRVFLADASGAWVTNLANPSQKTPLNNQANAASVRAVDGFYYPAIKAAMDKVLSPARELNLHCVAHGGIAMVTGKTKALYLQHPYLHDTAPVAFLAQQAGYHVAIMPRFNDDKNGTKYPLIMAENEDTLKRLVSIYQKGAKAQSIESSGPILNGDMTEAAQLVQDQHWQAAVTPRNVRHCSSRC